MTERLLNAIKSSSARHPELRFGQLLENVLPQSSRVSLFYIPDDELAEKLEQY